MHLWSLFVRVLVHSRAAYGTYSIWLPKCHWYARNVCSHLGIMIFLNEFCTYTQSPSFTHTWHVYRQCIPKRLILSISTCLYIFVADGPFFDKDIDGKDNTNISRYGYQKPQPSNSPRTEVNKSSRLSQSEKEEEVNLQRIFIKININAKLKLHALTSNIVLNSLRICLTWDKNAPFLFRMFDVIFSQQQQQILGHMMLCLYFSERAQNLRPLNWTEHPNDDDDGILLKMMMMTSFIKPCRTP